MLMISLRPSQHFGHHPAPSSALARPTGRPSRTHQLTTRRCWQVFAVLNSLTLRFGPSRHSPTLSCLRHHKQENCPIIDNATKSPLYAVKTSQQSHSNSNPECPLPVTPPRRRRARGRCSINDWRCNLVTGSWQSIRTCCYLENGSLSIVVKLFGKLMSTTLLAHSLDQRTSTNKKLGGRVF